LVEKSDLSSDVEALRADLARLKEDLRSMGGSLADQARGSARSAKDAATAKWDDSVSAVHHQIEERPFTSVLVAFGVGLLVGKILDSK
jgi:ElaB/YqjD/DUF883 family membrane-anchored ribosome-binding protein